METSIEKLVGDTKLEKLYDVMQYSQTKYFPCKNNKVGNTKCWLPTELKKSYPAKRELYVLTKQFSDSVLINYYKSYVAIFKSSMEITK